MTQPTTQPLISIIMPTYNRAGFLKDAFASILSQGCTDWELIVVDDGSTDDTKEIIEREFANIDQPTKYIYQENQGAYSARNTGLENASGKYIAFYDSDDQWLPHHLQDCAEALESNPELDWVFGSLIVVNSEGNQLSENSSFYRQGQPAAFLSLKNKIVDELRIIQDDLLAECMITNGNFTTLQYSLIRASVFNGEYFQSDFRNSEDYFYSIRAAKRGCIFGYYDNVHLRYHTHNENSSADREGISAEYLTIVQIANFEGFTRLKEQVKLSPQELKIINSYLSGLSFWRIGYLGFWSRGQPEKALDFFQKGLKIKPFHLPFWKTYLLARVKCILGLAPKPAKVELPQE